MIEFANLLGKLNWNALPHDPITAGGAATVVGGVVVVAAVLTYFKRWKWLWKEWLTSLDPKKDRCLMYIVVALVMLIRAGTDALMIRACSNPSLLAVTRASYPVITFSRASFQPMEPL